MKLIINRWSSFSRSGRNGGVETVIVHHVESIELFEVEKASKVMLEIFCDEENSCAWCNKFTMVDDENLEDVLDLKVMKQGD